MKTKILCVVIATIVPHIALSETLCSMYSGKYPVIQRYANYSNFSYNEWRGIGVYVPGAALDDSDSMVCACKLIWPLVSGWVNLGNNEYGAEGVGCAWVCANQMDELFKKL